MIGGMAVAENDRAKVVHVVWQRIYRNMELEKWIDKTCETKDEKVIAWKTAFRIGEMYPEVKDKIRGELIDEDTQEETEWE